MFDPREIADRAATLLDHAGSCATPGPWVRNRPPGHAHLTAAVPAGEVGNRAGRVVVCEVPTGERGRFVRGRASADLDWIGLLDPTVAPVLAGLLREAEALAVVPRSVARLAAHLVGGAGASLLRAAGVGEVLIPSQTRRI